MTPLLLTAVDTADPLHKHSPEVRFDCGLDLCNLYGRIPSESQTRHGFGTLPISRAPIVQYRLPNEQGFESISHLNKYFCCPDKQQDQIDPVPGNVRRDGSCSNFRLSFFQEFQGSGYSGGSPAEAGRRAYLSRKERAQPFVETICLILPNQNTHRRGRSATIRIFWIKSNHSRDISLPAPTQQRAHNKLLLLQLQIVDLLHILSTERERFGRNSIDARSP